MTSTEIFIVILVLFVILSFVFNFFLFAYYAFYHVLPTLFLGAFFAKSRQKEAEKMILFSRIKPGEKVVDLGSGDGSLVIAMAQEGAEAHGYEINPFLVWLSRKNIKNKGLEGKAFIHLKNFWLVDFSEFNAVTVYGISYIMKRLEGKLQKELKPGSRVVSNYFTFPGWQHQKKEDNVYLYVK